MKIVSRHIIMQFAVAFSALVVSTCGLPEATIQVRTNAGINAQECAEKGKCIKDPKGLVVYNSDFVTDKGIVKRQGEQTLLAQFMNLIDEPKLLVASDTIAPLIRGISLVGELQPCDSPKKISGSNPTAAQLRQLKEGRFKACIAYMGDGLVKKAYALDPIEVDVTAPQVSGSVTVQNVTPVSGLLQWPEAADNVTLQEGLRYNVYTSKTNSLNTIDAVHSYGNIMPGKIIGGTSYTMTSLLEKTQYHAAVVVFDEAGNEALLGSADFSTSASDTTAPSIVSISSVSGSYRLGANIDVDVNFSESLTVTGTSSSLTLTGGRTASYLAKPDADTMRYRYVVQATDNATDINVTSFNINSDTIRDAALNDAMVSLPTNNLATTSDVNLDNIGPTPTVTSNRDPGPTNNTSIVLAIQFSEPVFGFDASRIQVSNATKGTFTSVSSDTFTLALTATSSPVSASLALGAVQDAAENQSAASNAWTLTINGAAATPVASLVAGLYTSARAVTLTSTTVGASIYYTVDGSTPTASSTMFSGSIFVGVTQTIKAIAIAPNYNDSSVAAFPYTITGTVQMPTFSVPAGAYGPAQTVALTSSTPGASIYYTIDNSAPTISSTLYAGPITVSTSQTIKAVAVLATWADSNVATALYTINGAVADPTFGVTAGAYNSSQSVSLSTTTPGASIYYTMNGTVPTTASTLYSSPISIMGSTTLKAIAVKSAFLDSAVTTAVYTIDTIAPNLSSASVTTASPSTSLTANVAFTLSEDAVVVLYSDSGCSTTPISSASTKPLGANVMSTNSLPANYTTIIYAKATDAVGNDSACTTIGSYTHDNIPPVFTSFVLANDAADSYINIAEYMLTNDLAGPLVASGQSSTQYSLVLSGTTCALPLTWVSTIPRSNDSLFASDGASYKICLQLSDAAGNVSYASSPTMTLDLTPPMFTSVALANAAADGVINNADTSSGLAVIASLVATDSATYKLALSTDNCSAQTGYSVTVPTGSSFVGFEGNFKVCIKLSDAAGNTSYGNSATIQVATILPVLTTFSDKVFKSSYIDQGSTLNLDWNNANTSSDSGMSYSCTYDQVIDSAVASGPTCASLPGTASFNTAAGTLSWTPNSNVYGAYELKIVGTHVAGSVTAYLVVDVRQPYVKTNLRADLNGSFSNVSGPQSGAASTWYDLTTNSYDGIINGTTSWSGTGSTASPYRFNFTGSQSVSLGSSVLASQTKMMFDTWVSPSSANSANSVIMGNSKNATGNGFTLRQSKSQSGKVELVVGKSYQDIILADSPSGFWRLGELNGTSAVDISGNNNNGSFVGVPNLGQTGGLSNDSDTSVTFNGSNQMVKIANNTAVNIAGAQSIEVWFKTTFNGSGIIFSSWDGTNGAQAYVVNNVANCYSGGALSSGVTVNDGKWHQLACVWDGANNLIYVDGVLRASRASTVTATVRESQIGTQCSGAGSTTCTVYFNGSIDEVSFYNLALSASQIRNHFLAGNNFAGMVMASSPVGYWRLNEDSGTTAADSSSYANSGTYSNVTLSATGGLTGYSDVAASFNGTSSYVSIPDSVSLSPTSQVSVAAWIKPTANNAGNSYQSIVAKGYVPNSYGIRMTRYSEGPLIFAEGNFGGVGITSSGIPIAAGQWYFVVMTYNGSALSLYINGWLASSVAASGAILDSTTDVTIGTNAYNERFYGSIDDVAIYNTALSATQIRAQYLVGSRSYNAIVMSDSPVGYWRLGEPAGGTTGYDQMGTYPGTYSGEYTLGGTGPFSSAGATAAQFNPSVNTGKLATASPIISGSGDFSFEAWVSTSNPSGVNSIAENYGTSGCTSGVQFAIYQSKAQVYINGWLSGTTTISANTWYHIVYTRTSGTGRIYVNGVLESTGIQSNSISSGTCNFTIGGNTNYSSEPFRGKIAEVAVYSSALTVSQILAHYNAASSAPGSWGSSCGSITSMSNSSWYNLAGIVDGSTAKLHVNGTQECSVNIGGGFLTPASDLVLGATSTGLNAWSGSMGEVRIYGTSNGSAVGTAADITTNLTATKIRYPLNDINFVSTYGIVFQADAAHGLGLNTPMTSGVCPGNWVDLSPTGVVGTPLNFASCSPTSGAQGSGTTADPYRVVFDGINDTIDFGSNSAFDRLTGDFTIEQWIKSANVGNYQTPFSLDDAATGNGILFYTAVTSGYTRTWIGGVGYNGGTTIVDGNWHQAIIMRKAGIAYHYIDGTQTGTITSAGSALTGQRLRLGTYNGASGYPYNGSIARTVFYNRALSPTERTQNCAAIASRFTGVTCH